MAVSLILDNDNTVMERYLDSDKITNKVSVGDGLEFSNGTINVSVGDGLEFSNGTINVSEQPSQQQKTPALTPFGIPDDLVSAHFDGEIAENVIESNGKVTKIWDNTGKGYHYTATEAMNYTYDSSGNRLEMTGTTGQRMKASLPTGASNASQPYSWTIVSELSETTPANWEDSLASVIFNLFNADNGTDKRLNSYYSDAPGLRFFGGDLTASSTNFWNHDSYSFNAPLKLIITANYNSTDDATDIYINNRWFGQDKANRNVDEIVIGNDNDTRNLAFTGYIYECFFTNDSLTESQIGKIHSYLNDKWNVFTKKVVDIFTCAGQSNMAGRGDSSSSPNPDFGFYLDPQYWNASRTRMNTIIDPVGGGGAPDQATSGSCIPSFCNEYYNQTGRIPVVLFVADGGTSIFENTEWNPDVDGNYTTDVIDILSNAESHLTTAGWEIGTKNILWHQGETDQGTAVQTYKDKFLSLVDKFLNNGYDNFYYYEISERDNDDLNQVREAQRLAHQERDNLFMVWSCENFNALGLMVDSVHYNQTGYNLMGRQGAKAVSRIQKLKN
jgi:YD repeat-containing protein